MEFCKQFNALKFEGIDAGAPIPVIITAYKDKSFTFITKLPPVSYLIMKEISLTKGSSNPGKDIAGTINKKNIENIQMASRRSVRTSRPVSRYVPAVSTSRRVTKKKNTKF